MGKQLWNEILLRTAGHIKFAVVVVVVVCQS